MPRKLLAAVLVFTSLICSALAVASASASEERTAELPIIMYHHILKAPNRWGDYVISPQQLESDLKYLKAQGYTAVGCGDLLAWYRGEAELPEKPVMLTFDDGQESVEAYALPLLEQYDMCAVLAIVGSIADAYTQSDDHNIAYSYLGWPAIQALSASPRIEFAVHTHNLHSNSHRRGCARMRGESPEAYAQMLNSDLATVESRFIEYTWAAPVAFAYPFGHCCSEAEEILVQRGYKIAFTCDERVNRLTGDWGELMSLGRFNRPSGVSSEVFFGKVAKIEISS